MWRNCLRCGNRYPVNDGYGFHGEFCSGGCAEDWYSNHPGYYEREKKRIRRKRMVKFIVFLICVFFVLKIIAM